MKQEEKRKFYSLAKYPNLEILMDSQLVSAGANQAKILEKYKKNKNAIKHQLIALKVVYAFIFIFIPFFSVWGYIEIVGSYSSSAPLETLFLANSFVFSVLFLMSLLYVLLMGLFSTSSFMSGNAFKWLQTLPLSRKELKKLGYVTVFRNLDVALIALVLGFPTILLILTRNLFLFLTCLFSSAINAIFAFSILIILSEKMANIFSESRGNSKKASILRIASMGGFFVLAFGSSFLLSFAMNFIDELFVLFPTNQSALLLNRILSFIPFPFGITYVIAFMAIPGAVPIDLLITSLIGLVLFIGLTYLLYRTAINQIKSVFTTEIEVDEKKRSKGGIKKEIIIEVNTVSPIKSFIRKDLISTTRDYQSFIFLIMPIVYPIILILSFIPLISQEVNSIETIIILWSIIVGINQFIPFLLVAGFLNIEESGISILSSLPLLSRTQAKAKVILMITIQAIGLGLMGILLTILTQSLMLLVLFILTIPVAWIFLLFTFELKVRFFGKLKYKYVVEEVNKQRKVLKWIAMIFSVLSVYFGVIILEFNLLAAYGILGVIIGLIVISIIGLSSLIYIFTRMFPKEEEMKTYSTGGLLRRNVIAGTIIIMILYFLFQQIVGFIELPFLGFLWDLPIEFTILIEVILVFIVFIFLFFYIVPRGMKLPKGDTSLKTYSNSIGLSKIQPFALNLSIGLVSFTLFSLSTVLLALLLGNYIFDPNVLFSYPNWVLLYFMLIPGIWEEIAFRGVILNLQLRKYSTLTAIILNGVAFGIMHMFNFLGGGSPFYVINQVVYATCLGVALSYIFVKTKSLLPCIILHYSIDSFGQLFIANPSLFPNLANLTIYLIFGVGIIPMLLILGFIKLVKH